MTSSLRSHLSVIVAAQRQIGETLLNEMSSRSHQIIRLVMLLFQLYPYGLRRQYAFEIFVFFSSDNNAFADN